jgi:hypothetical protein
MQSDTSIFAEIARSNYWGSEESISGPGSTLEVTESLRRGLEVHLPALGIKTLVDAPCGDLNWIRHLQYRFERYIGIDLVPEIIEKLRKLALPRHHFQTGNIVTDILPTADAILCRDCLVHLPFEAAKSAMRLMSRSGCRYIMATTFPHLEANADILLGQWRMLNLQAAPFNLPPPMILIHDGDHHLPPYDDKSLGIWKAEDFKPAT